jgi:hypothetical protein
MAGSDALSHRPAVYAVAIGTAVVASLTGAQLGSSRRRVRYLLFWAPARFWVCAAVAAAAHGGLVALTVYLAARAHWSPIDDPDLWWLDAIALAAVTESALRADWSGQWLSPAGEGHRLVRVLDGAVAWLGTDRADQAVERFVANCPPRLLVAEAYRLLEQRYTRRPDSGEGRRAWKDLKENVAIIDELAPRAAEIGLADMGRLTQALTAVRSVLQTQIPYADDRLGNPDKRPREVLREAGVVVPRRPWWP